LDASTHTTYQFTARNSGFRNIYFDPSLPYMYVPQEDWYIIRTVLIDPTKYSGDIPITTSSETIYWEKTCAEVKLNMPRFHLQVSVYDEENGVDKAFVINLYEDKWRIDGKYFNHPTRCYLPVFRHYKDVSSVDI